MEKVLRNHGEKISVWHTRFIKIEDGAHGMAPDVTNMGKGNPAYGKKSWNSGKKLPQFSGENHPFWKGGFHIDIYGYKVLQSIHTNGKKILEHRKIMAEYLGRELRSEEIIHHINGDKLDNRIENLQIVTRSEHINMHRYEL